MRKRFIVRLSEGEREQLSKMIRAGKGKVAAMKRLRAQILLKIDEGPLGSAWTDRRAAEAFDVYPKTVSNIRQRLVEGGLERALSRKKQAYPSRARLLDGEGEARLVTIACGAAPGGRRRWTLELLADRLVKLKVVDQISHETVRQVLKKTN